MVKHPKYDPKCPPVLKQTQKWFGQVIERAIDQDSKIQCVAPSGASMEKEASQYIAPSPYLQPLQRIEIYNQQYWWRLLKCLHENFPFLTRLFGYTAFNESIAKPALEKYPPSHWSLNRFGEQLPRWIEEEYHAEDRRLILDAARIDWAALSAFTVGELPPLKQQMGTKAIGDLANSKLKLQPYLHLFRLRGDLFHLRDLLLEQSVEYWETHDFPLIRRAKAHCFILYRDRKNQVVWREISLGQYFLLDQLIGGATLAEACEALQEADESMVQDALENLHFWTQEWAARGWLSLG